MALSCKYSIQDINNIIFNGFEYKLDERVIEVISNLTSEVGSPTYIKTPNFQKQNTNVDDNKLTFSKNNNKNNKNNLNDNYKRKKNKNNEVVRDDDWETIRTFSTTKIEQHEGIDVIVDTIRSDLNKMSVKTYDEINNNVNNTIDLLLKENICNEELIKIGNIIFDIVSSNRFYSKLYANLYSILMYKYEFLNIVFNEKIDTFMNVLNTVEYVSPDDNYDLFCKINNDNEKRKALTAFIVNLSINKVISVSKMEELLLELLEKVNNLIKEDNKKFIVDEYVELIFILYDKELFSLNEVNVENNEKIINNIRILASVKVKTYPSLSSKSIFKLMDIIEM